MKMATMKAVRFHGQKDIRIDEVEIPTCGKDQVKVRISILTQLLESDY